MTETATPPTQPLDLSLALKGYVDLSSGLLLASLGTGVVLWHLESKFKAGLEDTIDGLVGKIDGKFEALEDKIDGKFEAFEEKLDRLLATKK